MKIKNICIEKLFGYLDYNLSFDDMNPCIITGPNGYGKTVILNIIKNILNMNFDYFDELKFKSIKVVTDRSEIEVSKINLPLSLYVMDSELSYGKTLRHDGLKIKTRNRLFLYPFEYINNDDEIKNNSVVYDIKEKISKVRGLFFSYISNDFINNGSVLFIADQRVFHSEKKDITAVLPSLAINLVNVLNEYVGESNAISQKLDGSFPVRLFQRESKTYNIPMLKERLRGLLIEKNKYISYGLLEGSGSNDNELYFEMEDSRNQERLAVLELYLEDSIEKYKPYDFIIKKIKLFEDMVNGQELSFKKIYVHYDYGFSIKSDDNEEIDLSLLSSGEQNQIVLLYKLIFGTKIDDLVLIDEPEISLHVAWQTKIIENLRKVMKLNEIDQFIIATHSPHVIDGNWNLTLDLFESMGRE